MSTSILDLPNELLFHALTNLSTIELLPLASISRRIHALICRILHTRIYKAANLADHTLLLECYHPSQKLTEPPLFCTYLGTPTLDINFQTGATEDGAENSAIGRLDALRKVYSMYKPFRRPVNRRPHPAGDIPGSRTHTAQPASSSSSPSSTDHIEISLESEPVRQTFSLESHELFTQLCCVTNLVLVGPRNGLFRSFVEIKEGVVRIWRHYLEDMARYSMRHLNLDGTNPLSDRGKEKQTSNTISAPIEEHDPQMLWVDLKKNVGLRVKVLQKKWVRNVPVIMNADEEISVYEIEYQELVIRTSHLLLMLEKSFNQEHNHSGKAVVFGAFGTSS